MYKSATKRYDKAYEGLKRDRLLIKQFNVQCFGSSDVLSFKWYCTKI